LKKNVFFLEFFITININTIKEKEKKMFYEEEFIKYIRDNILIEDIIENMFKLPRDNKKSSINSKKYYFRNEKIITIHRNGANGFFILNTNIKGDNIKLVQYLKNCDFLTAVESIADFYNLDPNSFRTINFKPLDEKIVNNEKKANYYIHLYKNFKKISGFAENIRGISKNLLNYLLKQNKLKYYKSDKYQTIKIPLYSSKDEICGIQDIFKRENETEWEKRIHGHAGIFFVGNLDKIKSIIITESLFDSLSALQIHFNYNREKNLSYTFSNLLNELGSISINGSLSDLKRKALIDVIKNAKNLHTIVIAFDADQIGQKYKKEFIELLQSKNILNNYKILILNNYQGYKDFNEYLQAKIESGKIKQVS
jgi:hypothetical protein